MIICPIEGAVIFSDCRAYSCMWNTEGACKSGILDNRIPRLISDCTPEQLDAVQAVKQTVTVGLFLESYSGKEISNIKESDVPEKLVFETWAAKRKVNIASIDYNTVVLRILNNL